MSDPPQYIIERIVCITCKQHRSKYIVYCMASDDPAKPKSRFIYPAGTQVSQPYETHPTNPSNFSTFKWALSFCSLIWNGRCKKCKYGVYLS